MKTLGYKDISYHYGIELVNDQYEILKGRMDDQEGAHCLGFNQDSLGICVVGNFNVAPLAPAQLALLVKLSRSLMNIYGIKLANVLGHYETYERRGVWIEKTCPGKAFLMPDFRKML